MTAEFTPADGIDIQDRRVAVLTRTVPQPDGHFARRTPVAPTCGTPGQRLPRGPSPLVSVLRYGRRAAVSPDAGEA